MNWLTPSLRSAILFFVGIAGIIWVLVTKGTTEPTVIVILGMFAGLPLVLNIDGLIRKSAPSTSPAVGEPESKGQHSKPEVPL